jgi:hypothetical protein
MEGTRLESVMNHTLERVKSALSGYRRWLGCTLCRHHGLTGKLRLGFDVATPSHTGTSPGWHLFPRNANWNALRFFPSLFVMPFLLDIINQELELTLETDKVMPVVGKRDEGGSAVLSFQQFAWGRFGGVYSSSRTYTFHNNDQPYFNVDTVTQHFVVTFPQHFLQDVYEMHT